MKNDVVRWSTGNSKENSKLKTLVASPASAREGDALLHTSNESRNQSFISTSLVTIVTNPGPVSPSGPAEAPTPTPSLTRTLRDTKITKANVTIDCDNSFLVKPIETSNLLSRHSKVSDYVGTNKYQSQMSDQRNRNNRDKRSWNLAFRHVIACSLHFTILILLCHFNLGVTASGYIETNTDNLLTNEIPYELVYENSELSGTSPDGHYTHTWAVHIPNGDSGVADEVAKDHGFINLGKIFDDHYHFAHHKVTKRSLQPADDHQTRLDEDHRVHWAKQQRAKSRQKRDFIYMRPSRTSSRSLSSADSMEFDDPRWPQMWYLNRGNGLDMNVIPAWKDGITGKGIVVTILDDGLESDHPDLEHNYDKKASYDVNGHDDDPMPHYDLTDSNRHGTRCAGEVAATANNSICAVGIAFGARVGGVRMLDGDVTDAVEARSLSLHPQHIDIYSASWGPDDDGKTVDGPGELASRAFLEGVTKGRAGKGSIFIWASGNGGRELDNCNCDGYTNSIWTLSISSATEEGHVPWYSEKCSSTLATTYSSGNQNEKQVVTTDLHHSCTQSHTGTSASAPLAAGIAALVLESNTNLTWRDLQHIVVRTAKPANLKDSTWSVNGVGRRISHSFGYGLMDAAAMVKLARRWKTVPEQQRCEINAPHVDKIIQPRGYITLQLTVKHCLAVNYLEHVQAKITLTSQRRGDIQLYLKSPAGTKVTLLTQRAHDASRSGFNQWPFMSVHTWGESPHGNWQLEIHNEGRYMGHAFLREWSLIFYGTTQPIDPKDPVSIAKYNSAEITTPNSNPTSTTNSLHQIYSPLYPRISPNNFGTIMNGKIPMKLPPNKSVYIAGNIGSNSGEKLNKKLHQNSKQQQQNYQQISSTYGIMFASPNKNKQNGGGGGKGKNKSNESKGKKNGGHEKGSNGNKKDKEQNSSVSSSLSSSIGSLSSNSGKNKLYRLLQQQQQQQNGKPNNKGQQQQQQPQQQQQQQQLQQNLLQSSRPKIQSQSQSSEKSSVYGFGYDDKKSRKVIGDLPVMIPSNINKMPLKNAGSLQNLNIVSGIGNGNENRSGGSGNSNTNNGGNSATVGSYPKLSIKATKQIKESLMPPISSSSSGSASSLEKTHEKLIIKGTTSSSSSSSASSIAAKNVSSNSRSDQRIPKLFEHYEKIQAIFPEFEPYQGREKDTSLALEKRKQSQIFEAETFRPLYANSNSDTNGKIIDSSGSISRSGSNINGYSSAGSVSKPSRENSKKSSPSFIPDQRIMKKQQLLLAAAGVGDSILDDSYPERSDIPLANRKTAKAKITQWDLIFYGTEAPAQPDDPVHFGPGQLSPLGNDMVTNDIEDFDNSRQWHNMKQVGDNTFSHDKTNVSCVTTTTDNRCLACAPPTFLYKNRCYDECPIHTFEMSLQAAHSDNNIILDNHLDSDANNNESIEELQSMDRRKRQNEFIDLPVTTTRPLESATNICGECDASCLKCYGPLNSQCSTCFPGSQLRKLIRSNETFCYVFTERSTGNEDTTLDTSHKKSGSTGVKVALIAAPIFIICAILAFFRLTGSKWEIPFATSSQQVNEFNVGCLTRYNYDRVALISDDDDADEDDEEYDLFSQTPAMLPGKQNTIISTKSEGDYNEGAEPIDQAEMENVTDTKIDFEGSFTNATGSAEETAKLLDESR